MNGQNVNQMGFSSIGDQFMNQIMNQFGGPQQFQQQVNYAQQQLQQANMNPQQFLQQQVQSGGLTQQELNAAMQKANMIMGRR